MKRSGVRGGLGGVEGAGVVSREGKMEERCCGLAGGFGAVGLELDGVVSDTDSLWVEVGAV